jgi:hypothetical protein
VVPLGGEIKDPKISASMIKGTKVNIMRYEKYLEQKTDFKSILYYFFMSLFGFVLIWLTTLTTNSYIIFSSFLLGIMIIVVSSTFIIYFGSRGLIKEFLSYLKHILHNKPTHTQNNRP